MTDPLPHSLENLLRHIAATSQPWYPSAFAKEAGLPRDSLDQPLERLRLAGLIRLTDWVKDLGQGYVLTPDGTEVVNSPKAMAQLGNGFLPARRETSEPTILPLPERGASAWDRGEAVRDALLRPMDPTVTKVLLALNILWFFAGLGLAVSEGMAANDYLRGAGPGFGRVVVQEGALTGDTILEGQWWRLLTCCFVHFGWMHIGANMYSLYVVGPMMERMWGRVRYLVIYLLAGFVGSCAMLAGNPWVPGGGASGAIWGIFASQAVWILHNRAYLPPALRSAWWRSLTMVFLLNVGISLLPGISAAAHFGGGLAGALAGTLLGYHRYGSRMVRWLSVIGLGLLPVAGLGMDFWAMNTRLDWIEIRLRDQAAVQVLKLYDDQLKPTLSKPPFDADKVAQARTAIQQERGELLQFQKALNDAGAASSKELEDKRQAYLSLTAGLLEMCDHGEKALEGGPDWKEDAKALTEDAEALRRLLKGH